MIVASYLMFSVLLSSLSIIYADYVHGVIGNEFKNDLTFNINFFALDLSLVSLYAVDTSGNKLSMTSGAIMQGDTRHFISHFNAIQFNWTVRGYQRYYGGYLGRLFGMKLSITNNNLYYHEYNWSGPKNLAMSNIFDRTKTQSDAFSGFPPMRDFKKKESKTFVWIFTVDPKIGQNKYGPQNMSIGCVNLFYLNDKPMNLVSNGAYFAYRCKRHISENICNRNKCQVNVVEYNILDCSRAVMNTRKYCWEDLSVHGHPAQLNLSQENNLSHAMVKLAWKPLHLKSNCLVEIVGKNETVTLFHTNNNDEVIMCHGVYGSMNCAKKIWQKLSINKIYVLLIEWKDKEMTVKISDGSDINTFIDDIITNPRLVNIGFASQSIMCGSFDGAIAFRYDTFQLQYIKKINKSYSWQIILPCSLLVTSMVLVCFICIASTINRLIKNDRRPILNQYEEEVQFINIPSLPINQNHQSQQFTYEYIL